jgi:hypothetical protein
MSEETKPALCGCCRTQREGSGQKPRELVSFEDPTGKDPYLLCGYCDGDAILGAMAQENERSSGE